MSLRNQFTFNVEPFSNLSEALDTFVEVQMLFTIEDWGLNKGCITITPLHWDTIYEGDKQQFVTEFKSYIEQG